MKRDFDSYCNDDTITHTREDSAVQHQLIVSDFAPLQLSFLIRGFVIAQSRQPV